MESWGMQRPAEELDQAVRLVLGVWTPLRAAEVERRVRVQLHRRARRRRNLVVGSLGMVLGTAAGLLLVLRGPAPPERAEIEAVPSPETPRWTFVDHSIAEATGADTDLRVVERTNERHVVRVLRGGARFDVVHRENRLFRVEIRDVAIEVLGTAFRAEALGEGVKVSVERGRVRVQHGREEVELGKDEARFFPPLAATLPVRGLAQADDDRRPHPAPARPALDRPAALLHAADLSRSSGHPVEALGYLQEVVAQFPHDELAPLAAFTMGLLELEQLGRPADAAHSFARAIRLAPRGELAEDALAREVEAWSTAGEKDRARAQATEYLRRYPDGRRAASVRRFADRP
jgi:hypothetical protein